MCQHAARYLANQDWVKNDSLKTVENTAVILFLSLSLLIVIYLISLLLSWFLVIYHSVTFSYQIPIIMLVVEVPQDVITSSAPMIQSLNEEPRCTPDEHGNDNHSDTIQLEDLALQKGSQMKFDALKSKSVRLDISFKSPSHTGLQTTEMVISNVYRALNCINYSLFSG